MTAFGTSTAVLNELKGKREVEFGISHWPSSCPKERADPEVAARLNGVIM